MYLELFLNNQLNFQPELFIYQYYIAIYTYLNLTLFIPTRDQDDTSVFWFQRNLIGILYFLVRVWGVFGLTPAEVPTFKFFLRLRPFVFGSGSATLVN